MAESWHFLGVPEVWQEARGRAMIAQLNLEGIYPAGLFVRFQSWKDDGQDHEVEKVVGKLLRITVEVVDSD